MTYGVFQPLWCFSAKSVNFSRIIRKKGFKISGTLAKLSAKRN